MAIFHRYSSPEGHQFPSPFSKALPAASSTSGAHDLPALLHGFQAAALAGAAVPGPVPRAP